MAGKSKEIAVKQQSNSKKRVPGKPFKKGQSGNPNGRPKKEFNIPDILRKLADEPSEKQKKITRLEQVCLKALEQAQNGDKDARQWIANRMEGMAKQSIDMKVNQNVKIEEKLNELKDATEEQLLEEINNSIILN